MIINHVPSMIDYQNQIVNSFGKDQTGQINYQFNQQGFRGSTNFNFIPDYAFFGCSLVFGIGVPEQLTFPYLFNHAHNYGLAGSYDNHDIMLLLENFLNSELYAPQTKIAVVWHSRDADCLDDFYSKLKQYLIIHFFCGQCLPYVNCYSTPANLDYDVSNTHYGVNSHRVLWKTLNCLFQQ
jgi:hypothetical protein